MKKIFIRSGMAPTDGFSAGQCIVQDVYGSNTGNLLYAHGIYRALMVDTEVVFEPNYYRPSLERAEEINETCKSFIIPLADAFRKDFVYELRNLTELVKQLSIPCVVTGVGLRAPYEPDFSTSFSFDEDVRAFVKAVLEKSVILGLRGELTAAYLKKLGFREEIDFTIIGCPSMYLKGADLSVRDGEITGHSRICANSSIYIPREINDFVMENMRRFADYYFIPQQTSELRLAYVGSPYNGGVKYGNYPARITDPLFSEGRYKAFLDVQSWLEFMSQADFCFGGRLHGNIAAALGGIPNLMITSDARMRELSEYHGLAHASLEEMRKASNIFELIGGTDFRQVLKKQKVNFEHFKSFLRTNGLDNIYSRGVEGEAPLDKLLKGRKKQFRNFALCDDGEKLARIDSFYMDFNRVYDRYANGYKEMSGIHENDVRNYQALWVEKQVLSNALGNYHRQYAISHIVVDLATLPEDEVLEFLACVEDAFEPDCGRVVHLLASGIPSVLMRTCRLRKKAFPDYMIEENADPNLLRTQMFTYYYFDANMEFWEKLFASSHAEKGVCHAFLSDFLWKTQNNVIWPYHLQGEQWERARNRVIGVLDQVPDEFILDYNGVDNFYRSYLFDMKSKGHTKVMAQPEALQIVRNGNVIYEAKKLEIVLTKFRPVKNRIHFIAFIKSPVFNFCEEPILWMESNGDAEGREKIPLKKSSWSYYRTKEETNAFYTFILNINTKEKKKFHFYVEIDGTMFDTYYYFMPEVVFSTKLSRYRYYCGSKEYRFDHNTFLVRRAGSGDAQEYREYTQGQFRETEPETCEYRELILENRQKEREIWLYYDCKGVYKDNGYLQFVHDFEKKDGIERYYILNNELEGCRELFSESQLTCVVAFGSDEHRMLYCLASKVVTAYIEKNNYLPFTDTEYAKLMDVATMPMIIYLQHGVYHAHIPWKYSLDRLQLDKKVISAKFERRQDMADHCFTKQYELTSCMPRFDFLDVSAKPKKKILFAPSWRKYLVDMVGTEWVTREDVFLESKFYRETETFLNDDSLIRFLRRHRYTLEFKPHPILARYRHLYHLDGETVSFASVSVKEEDYAIFITDFSSYVYDFAYLRRSILYFVPDYEEFQSGMNDYRECVLPFENGLGEFADQAGDAICLIKRLVRRRGRPASKYAKKMDDIFYHKDGGARQRIYENLMKGRPGLS